MDGRGGSPYAYIVAQEKLYNEKRVFNIFLAQCLPCICFFLFISVSRHLESKMAGNCSISVVNNSVLNESRVDCFNIFRKVRTRWQPSNLPLRAERGRAARGNGATVHSASHLAARHKAAAASRGETMVPAADSICSAVTLTAAMRI